MNPTAYIVMFEDNTQYGGYPAELVGAALSLEGAKARAAAHQLKAQDESYHPLRYWRNAPLNWKGNPDYSETSAGGEYAYVIYLEELHP